LKTLFWVSFLTSSLISCQASKAVSTHKLYWNIAATFQREAATL